MKLAELQKVAKDFGVAILDRGNGHFQIKGRLLVNFYPNARRPSAYVAGTKGAKRFVDARQACCMALEPPEFTPGKAERAKSYRRVKVRLFKHQKRCHWCHCKLTLETATVDHVIPLSRNGLDNDNNRVLACEACNRGRGHAMPEMSK